MATSDIKQNCNPQISRQGDEYAEDIKKMESFDELSKTCSPTTSNKSASSSTSTLRNVQISAEPKKTVKIVTPTATTTVSNENIAFRSHFSMPDMKFRIASGEMPLQQQACVNDFYCCRYPGVSYSAHEYVQQCNVPSRVTFTESQCPQTSKMSSIAEQCRNFNNRCAPNQQAQSNCYCGLDQITPQDSCSSYSNSNEISSYSESVPPNMCAPDSYSYSSPDTPDNNSECTEQSLSYSESTDTQSQQMPCCCNNMEGAQGCPMGGMYCYPPMNMPTNGMSMNADMYGGNCDAQMCNGGACGMPSMNCGPPPAMSPAGGMCGPPMYSFVQPAPCMPNCQPSAPSLSGGGGNMSYTFDNNMCVPCSGMAPMCAGAANGGIILNDTLQTQTVYASDYKPVSMGNNFNHFPNGNGNGCGMDMNYCSACPTFLQPSRMGGAGVGAGSALFGDMGYGQQAISTFGMAAAGNGNAYPMSYMDAGAGCCTPCFPGTVETAMPGGGYYMPLSGLEAMKACLSNETRYNSSYYDAQNCGGSIMNNMR